jgi:hypothetical protein
MVVGSGPEGMVPITVLLAVSITEIVSSSTLATYTREPSGDKAIPSENAVLPRPTTIRPTFALVVISMTVTRFALPDRCPWVKVYNRAAK